MERKPIVNLFFLEEPEDDPKEVPDPQHVDVETLINHVLAEGDKIRRVFIGQIVLTGDEVNPVAIQIQKDALRDLPVDVYENLQYIAEDIADRVPIVGSREHPEPVNVKNSLGLIHVIATMTKAQIQGEAVRKKGIQDHMREHQK